MPIDVLIERGQTKVFASALEWPGWARAARTPDEAVAALEAYVPFGVAVGIWLLLVALIWLHRPSRQLAGAALRLLPDMLRMLRALAGDPSTPRMERWLLIGLFAWLVSPIDLLPEFLPGIGPLDDIVVAAMVLRFVGVRLGHENLRAHWPGNDDGFAMVERLLRGSQSGTRLSLRRGRR